MKFLDQKFNTADLETKFREYTWNKTKILIRVMTVLFLLFWIWNLINDYFIAKVVIDLLAYIRRFLELFIIITILILSYIGPLKTRVRCTLWYTFLSLISIYYSLFFDVRTILCVTNLISTKCTAKERINYSNNGFYEIVGPFIIVLIFLNDRRYQLIACIVYIIIEILLMIFLEITYILESCFSIVVLIGGYSLIFLISYTHEKQNRQRFILLGDLNNEIINKLQVQILQEESEHEQDNFTSYIFHEIYVPLTYIKLSVDLIDRDNLFIKSLDSEELDCYNKIKISIISIENILNDTINYKKIDEEEEIIITNISFNLLNSFENSVWVMENGWKQKNINFQKSYDKHLRNVFVLGDENRLQQITNNYLSNAIKFTNKNGFINLSVNIINETENSITINVSVTDSGIGISLENQKTLFKPFVQINPQSTQSGKGTGLGLYIVAKIVTLMNGTYGVTSELGKGSTFWYTVTLEKSKIITIPKYIKNEEFMSSIYCLIVDDDKITRDVLKNILKYLGHSSDFAIDGQDCIEKCEKNRKENTRKYDLIIIDNLMPRMKGGAAIQWLREHQYDLPIISFTATKDFTEKQQLLNCGANYVLSKPSSISEIQHILQLLLTTKKYNSSSE